MNSIKLTGLWTNTSKDGQQYFSGNLNATTILQVWPNKYKRGEKDPDYQIILVQREQKKDGAKPANAANTVKNPTSQDDTSGADYLRDLPF